MATRSQQTELESITDRARNAIETGILAVRTARAISRPSSISLDVAFEAGSNPRRRRIVQHLVTNGPTKLPELTNVVAAAEHEGETPRSVSGARRKRVYVSLYQTHVPKLDGLGLVTYDEDNGVVQPTQDGADLARWLENTEFWLGGDA